MDKVKITEIFKMFSGETDAEVIERFVTDAISQVTWMLLDPNTTHPCLNSFVAAAATVLYVDMMLTKLTECRTKAGKEPEISRLKQRNQMAWSLYMDYYEIMRPMLKKQRFYCEACGE